MATMHFEGKVVGIDDISFEVSLDDKVVVLHFGIHIDDDPPSVLEQIAMECAGSFAVDDVLKFDDESHFDMDFSFEVIEKNAVKYDVYKFMMIVGNNIMDKDALNEYVPPRNMLPAGGALGWK